MNTREYTMKERMVAKKQKNELMALKLFINSYHRIRIVQGVHETKEFFEVA